MTAPTSAHPRTPVGIDPSKPNAARVWNSLLGGKDNYTVDQNMAERMRMVAPDMERAAWHTRRFLVEAVSRAANAGITQFLDLGCGLPHTPAAHEVAQGIQPDARLVAIDHDPMVFTHCSAMYYHTGNVLTMHGDIRDPDVIIGELRARGLVDFTQPVAVLMVGVLDYVMPDEDPAGIIERIRAALAPGSYLALTHASTATDPHLMARMDADTVGSTAATTWRSYEEIAGLLDGFDVLRPGLAPIQAFLDGDTRPTSFETLAAIGVVR